LLPVIVMLAIIHAFLVLGLLKMIVQLATLMDLLFTIEFMTLRHTPVNVKLDSLITTI
jgi:hypothetical protein